MLSCTHGFAFTCDSSSCISVWHDEESGNNFFLTMEVPNLAVGSKPCFKG